MELKVTPRSLPSIEVEGVRYPLFFSVLGMKAYAEHSGQTFQEVLTAGWQAPELSVLDLQTLLMIAFRGGEMKRTMTDGGGARTIEDELADKALGTHHVKEIWDFLITAWNEPYMDAEPNPTSEATAAE